MTDDKMREAFEAWWSYLTRQGDPLRIPNKFSKSFAAGWGPQPQPRHKR